ncbi:glycoside hydrolase family 65 protein [Streptomyces sp. TRM66268-LWL]|uniref:Glycoside hydrolase family 65 protein n=1 Tax=Streptomyces polyasparticus TaxID=2767826 RepID=A0ABR7SGG4_9ACTN|nr:glycoside hydrolase family 65 protein [Streptomyces polyasparticus]MBC9713949.1 glycoside hydrolase family 65 protein [Streptomyces polyasparticus]
MITQSGFTTEPWQVRERSLHLDVLPQTESLFALSNGHIGWRGNLDEGEPHGLPGSYLNGVFELRPMPYAEEAYGFPDVGESVINVTNGKLMRLLVDDEPFDLRYGTLHHHERTLDFRTGQLSRTVDWTSPAGRRVRVRSTRLVSLTQRAVAAIRYEVEPLSHETRVVVQSELVANEELPPTDGDPRGATMLQSPLCPEEHFATDAYLCLIHKTAKSALRVAVAAEHHVDGPDGWQGSSEAEPDLARYTVVGRLRPGQRLRVDKSVAYGWSRTRSLPALRDQVDAALAAARHTGWQGLADEQRQRLDEFWDRADVEVRGDQRIQQAVRFALFHVLQAGDRAEEQPIPAKGLTGPGYEGHCFWDTEAYILPILTYTDPAAVAQALRWRHSTLGSAQERARELGLAGAAFPWRTIAGRECSGYWPAGAAAFHVNAAIASAAVRYAACTGDEDFERDIGVDLLVNSARLWHSLGHHDDAGVFHIDGVTGPDEYSALMDDNLYTNLMAQQNLRDAADTVERHPDAARRLGVDEGQIRCWRRAADAMAVPYGKELQVHEQAAGFTRRDRWDFAATHPDQYPLMHHFHYFALYRSQVIKQADLVLALFLRGDAFAEEETARAFAYYEELTVRDSSLSAACQAVIAARTGHLDLAYNYLGETSLIDLLDLEHNTRDGLHLASLAGSWIALVAGFGGLRRQDGMLSFAPRLPDHLFRLAFRVTAFGRRISVRVTRDAAEYTLLSGEPLVIRHHGEKVRLADGDTQTRALPEHTPRRAPGQPKGREPVPFARD